MNTQIKISVVLLLSLAAASVRTAGFEEPGGTLRPVKAVDAQGGLAAGRATFQSRCAACHGLNGRGGEHAPDIMTNPAVRGLTDQAIYRIVSDGIIRAGMPAFRPLLTSSEIKGVVAYLHDARGRLPASHLPGNPARGETLFFGKAGCGECHAVHGRGGFLGSDLTDYGRDHAPGEIQDAILHADGALSRDRPAVSVTTRDGHQWTGVTCDEDNFSIQILDAHGVFHLVSKSDITSLTHELRKLMGDDYGARLDREELLDLTSFLAAGRSEAKP